MEDNPQPSPAVLKILGCAITDIELRTKLLAEPESLAQELSETERQELKKIVNKVNTAPEDFEALCKHIHRYIALHFISER